MVHGEQAAKTNDASTSDQHVKSDHDSRKKEGKNNLQCRSDKRRETQNNFSDKNKESKEKTMKKDKEEGEKKEKKEEQNRTKQEKQEKKDKEKEIKKTKKEIKPEPDRSKDRASHSKSKSQPAKPPAKQSTESNKIKKDSNQPSNTGNSSAVKKDGKEVEVTDNGKEEELQGDGEAKPRDPSARMKRVLSRSMSRVASTVVLTRRWLIGKSGEQENAEEGDVKGLSISGLGEDKAPTELLASDEDKSSSCLGRILRAIFFSTIIGQSAWVHFWLFFVATAYTYSLLFLVARTAFDLLNENYATLWLWLDYGSDAINLLDMMLLARTAYYEDGILVRNVKKTTLNYVLSQAFLFDAASIVPTDIAYAVIGSQPWLRFNRLLRFRRHNDFFERTEAQSSSPNALRMLRLLVSVFIMFHWNGCAYFMLSKAVGLEQDEWVFGYDRIINPKVCIRHNHSIAYGTCVDWLEHPISNLTKQYLLSLYWSALILTTLGEQPPPITVPEILFVTFDILIGLLVFAVIIGSVGSVISAMNSAKTGFQQNLDGSKQYMEYRKVHPVLQRRVISWFQYMWNQGQSLDEDATLAKLPPKLRLEIATQVHFETLRRVRIFQDAEAGLLKELVLRLQLQVASPGDYICKKGDIGTEMYIVKRGSLNVVSPDGKIVFVTLKEGSVFGELSVLNIPGNKTGNRRSASVRSVGYSDLFVLSKDDLWETLAEYPEAKKILMEKGKDILRKDNILDEEAAAAEEALGGSGAPNMPFEERAKRIRASLEKSIADVDEAHRRFIMQSTIMKRTITQVENKVWEYCRRK